MHSKGDSEIGVFWPDTIELEFVNLFFLPIVEYPDADSDTLSYRTKRCKGIVLVPKGDFYECIRAFEFDPEKLEAIPPEWFEDRQRDNCDSLNRIWTPRERPSFDMLASVQFLSGD